MWVEMVGRRPVTFRHRQIRPGQRVEVNDQTWAELQRLFPSQFEDLAVLSARRRGEEIEPAPEVAPPAVEVEPEEVEPMKHYPEPLITHVAHEVSAEDAAVPAMPEAGDLVQIHGIGASTAQILGEHGILSLSDLAQATDEQLKEVQPKLAGASVERLRKWQADAAALLGT